MGIANSKGERSSALKLCRERKRFIKQAIDSRYALAAAHVSYVQSLKNLGISLRRYAEAEVLVETSLSASATELDKTPSHSSFPSPSPSHPGGASDSNGSPLSKARVSYMRSSGATAFTVKLNTRNAFVEEGEFSMPPPPPPPPPDDSGWDYFDPADKSFRFLGEDGDVDADDAGVYGDCGKDFDFSRGNGIHEHEGSMTPKLESPTNGNGRLGNSQQRAVGEVKDMAVGKEASGKMAGKASAGQSNSKMNKPLVENDICAEREDPSEFITHRAKDFLSSTKDIDSRFFRASESGREVSRMLEANKIHVGYAEARGNELHFMPKCDVPENGTCFSCVVY